MIVILTTLVGGVIPVLSPNNDTRKIRAAARGLQGYIIVAQTQAARTGRPHGIAFRESSVGSGVALEVFGLEVPPPFAGFSTESRVRVSLVPGPTPYNSGNVDRYNGFPQYNGFPLYLIQFQLAGGTVEDALPPRMFRVGDEIDIDGNIFLIVDTASNLAFTTTVGTAPNEIEYLGTVARPTVELQCVWTNNNGQVPPQQQKRYRLFRQPTNSSESPYQLPAGIAIDMQGSVTEGNINGNRFPKADSLATNRFGVTVPTSADTVGIMFSATGAVDRVIFNGDELNSVSRVVLLLGRVENGGLDSSSIDLTQSGDAPWTLQTGEKFEDLQERINWLNLDSRLLSIVTSNGRAVVSEPAFVNYAAHLGGDDGDTAEEQIEAAHGFAHEMTTVGGN